jgi:hypothetical protein
MCTKDSAMFMPAISATQEAEVGGSWIKASSGKSKRPYLKKKLKAKKAKGLGAWLE